MSSDFTLFTKTVFHKVKAVSITEIESSTVSESELSSEDLNTSIDEFESYRKTPKIPSLPTESHNSHETLQEINKALWKAAEQGKPEVCQELLSTFFYGNHSADINFQGPLNWTPLHIAAFAGHTEVCKLLLSYKETVKLDPLSTTNSTPMHLACSQGHLEVAHLLFKSGADPNLRDWDGNNALHLAAKAGKEKIVTWLMLQNPDMEGVNGDGKTAEEVSSDRCKLLFVYYREIRAVLKRKNSEERVSFPPILERMHKRRTSVNPFS